MNYFVSHCLLLYLVCKQYTGSGTLTNTWEVSASPELVGTLLSSLFLRFILTLSFAVGGLEV